MVTGTYYEGRVTKPTCTKQGHTTYTCSCYGYSYKGDYITVLPMGVLFCLLLLLAQAKLRRLDALFCVDILTMFSRKI